MTCTSKTPIPASARAEGYTELLGDLVLSCTSGTPAAAGVPIVQQDLTVTLNVPVTNRKNTADNFIDALLLVDEPHSQANPNVPLTLCGAPGVDCNIIGTGNGAGVYSGVANRPNVFQGELTGTNTVRFSFPMDAPGIGVRTLRIVNLRADATRMAGQIPNTITATVFLAGASLPQNAPILGIVHPGLIVPAPSNATTRELVNAFRAALDSGCNPFSNSIWAASLNEITSAPKSDPECTIVLAEGSSGSWRPRNVAQALAAGNFGGSVSDSLTDLNQNVTGYFYGTESGFVNGTFGNPPNPIPGIAPTSPFPLVRGANRAGTADFGTRFFVSLTNVPAWQTFYLPVEIALSSQSVRTGSAVMVNSGTTAGMSRTVAFKDGLAPMSRSGNTLTAIYEIVGSDPAQIEMAIIPVVVASTRGIQPRIAFAAGLMPALGAATPDANAAIPRFAESSLPAEASLPSNNDCGSFNFIELTVAPIPQSTTPATSAVIRVSNYGAQSSNGLITVTAVLSSGLTASSISGTGWSCTLSSLTCTTSAIVPGHDPRDPSFPSAPDIVIRFNGKTASQTTLEISAFVSGGGDGCSLNNQRSQLYQVGGGGPLITTEPTGLLYMVDGVYYTGRRLFSGWPGETIQVSTVSRQYTRNGAEINFEGWSDNGSLNHSYAITSSPFSTVTASFDTNPKPMSCVYSGVPPLLRWGALTELIEPFLWSCKGGAPTPAGLPIAPVDLRLTFNAPITSRIVSPGFSEALLLIDEPHSSDHPSVPLLPCGASGSNDNGSGQCSMTANGTATYDGGAGHPNVFQGRPDGPNAILFKGVPIDPPGPAGERLLRFSNVRINATKLVSDALSLVRPIGFSSLSFDPPIARGAGFVAVTQNALVDPSDSNGQAPRPTKAVMGQCLAANPQIFGDSSRPLDTSGQGGFQTTVVATETFPSVFTAKSYAVQAANAGKLTTTTYPPDTRQDTPGLLLYTETGFFGGSSIGQLYPPFGFTIPNASTPFPSVRGLDQAGKAESGLRVYYRFTAIPTGVKLFVPTRIDIKSFFGSRSGQAALVSVDSNGSGPFSQVGGNASGLASLPVNGSEAVAIYEVLSADPYSWEALSVPVAVSFLAGQPGLGTIRLRVGLAPVSTVGVADATTPFPRFLASWADDWPVVQIATCGWSVDKNSLSFRAASGQSVVDPQAVVVSAPLRPSFQWSAVSTADWLTVNPTSGVGDGAFSVRVSSAGLGAGTYDGSVVVSSSGLPTQTVNVRFVVESNYTGFVDTKSCDAISGWAADRNRLNLILNVTLWSGGENLFRKTAGIVRPDVAAALGDNGAHGFSFGLPSELRDGVKRTYTLKFEEGPAVLGSSFDLACGPAAPKYTGFFESASCSAVTGWAADLSRLNEAISVDLVEGTTVLSTVLANGRRPDVGAYIVDNGSHGFSIPIPDSLKNGAVRTISMRYSGSTTALGSSPKTITCGSTPPPTQARYTGFFDYAGCDAARGWAADLNRLNQSVSVDLVEDSSVLATVLANVSRPDVGSYIGDNGLHGFEVPIPDSLKNGSSRSISMRFAGTTQALGSSPRTIQCTTTTPPPSGAPLNPTGFVDAAGCDAARGWAADLGRLNQAISVDLVEGTSILATVPANGNRPDVGAYIGDNGLHGFEIPIPDSLKSGASRTIQLRYTGTAKALNNSPNTIQCSSTTGPTRPTGFVDSAGCDAISGWAADLNRLNQPISIDIVEGSTILTTVVANANRSDVGSYIGDNGLHGFTVTTPTSLKTGASRTIQVRYSGTTQSLGNSPRTLQCAAQ